MDNSPGGFRRPSQHTLPVRAGLAAMARRKPRWQDRRVRAPRNLAGKPDSKMETQRRQRRRFPRAGRQQPLRFLPAGSRRGAVLPGCRHRQREVEVRVSGQLCGERPIGKSSGTQKFARNRRRQSLHLGGRRHPLLLRRLIGRHPLAKAVHQRLPWRSIQE